MGWTLKVKKSGKVLGDYPTFAASTKAADESGLGNNNLIIIPPKIETTNSFQNGVAKAQAAIAQRVGNAQFNNPEALERDAKDRARWEELNGKPVFKIGDKVITKDGSKGEILQVNHPYYEVKVPHGIYQLRDSYLHKA